MVMNRDNRLIMEAMHGRPEQIITSELHKVHTTLNQLSTLIHLNRSAETDQLLSKIRDVSEMLMTDAAAEDAEHMDGITKRRGELAGNIMDIVKHGIPSKEEFIKIRQQLHRKVKQIQDRGTAATEQEKQEGHRMMGQIRAYRSQHPNDPGPYADDPDGTATVAATPEVSLQPHGALADVTDVQIKSMNMLQNHGFYVSRVSNAHAEQMGGPVVHMGRNNGAMHQMAAVDPQGMINDESPAEYVKNHVQDEEAEDEDAEGRSNAQHAAIAISLQKAGKKPA